MPPSRPDLAPWLAAQKSAGEAVGSLRSGATRERVEAALSALAALEKESLALHASRKSRPEADDAARERRVAKAVKKLLELKGNPRAKAPASVDAWLDEAAAAVEESFRARAVAWPARFFPPAPGSPVPATGSGEGWEDARTEPKYAALLRVLFAHNVLPDAVVAETLEEGQMRDAAYLAVYATLPSGPDGALRRVTVATCDRVGEATFVRRGYVPPEVLATHAKGNSAPGPSRAAKVTWGEGYVRRLEQALFRDLWEEVPEPTIPAPAPATAPEQPDPAPIPEDAVAQFGLEAVLGWRAELLAAEDVLHEEACIVFEGGLWYFGDAKGNNSWPDVGGRGLINFPNAAFNKACAIGNERGAVQNSAHLARMFAALGLPVATPEQEVVRAERLLVANIPLWRAELEAAEAALRDEANIFRENGFWYFGDAKGVDSWPDVGGRRLTRFPNVVFNKARGIGDNNGTIHNFYDLARTFAALGLPVATPEQENLRWAKMLESAEPVLRDKANIVREGGIWYFGDANGQQTWPDVGGRSLMNFPNAAFNKARGIGNARGKVLNAAYLARQFAALGLPVATPEQENLRWAKMLESAEPVLRDEAGIVRDGGIWYLSDAKGVDKWPNVGGRKLSSFPNAAFKKARGIGRKNGTMSSSSDLARTFAALGLPVATVEQEAARAGRLLADVQIPAWRAELEAAELALSAEAGIIRENGTWYFGDARGSDSWPDVGGRSLVSFPNAAFNKARGIGDKRNALGNPVDLARMFAALGLVTNMGRAPSRLAS